jgi:glutamate racemase
MSRNTDLDSPIGIFDSGVGGLSVLRAIRSAMPEESVVYIGDQGHVPYGPRPLKQVRDFSEGITRFLLSRHAKIIVVACNSASAAALTYLRQAHPEIPFVGMEPAVKPAAEHTSSGVVGVLATPATFQGELYASVVERFAAGVELLKSTCPGLVQKIEDGDLSGPGTRGILEEALQPMLRCKIDTVVLACTHYPFVIPLIEEIVGQGVRVIDPAPAVARQTQRLLESHGLSHPAGPSGSIEYLTSGEAESFSRALETLLGENSPARRLVWERDNILTAARTPAS